MTKITKTLIDALLIGGTPESLVVPTDERARRLLLDAEGQRVTDRADGETPRDRMG